MAIFAISDLHLALGVEKPMDVFVKDGQIIWKGWKNYGKTPSL